jgi:hypothetical protein
MRTVPLFLALSLFSIAAQLGAQQSRLIGCISQAPDGGLQFEENPSGSVYQLTGDTARLTQDVNHLVVVSTPSATESQGHSLSTLVVQRINIIDESCTSPAPSAKASPVVGKVGEGQVAIPVTTSASPGETTPGFQTEAITQQEPPNSGRSIPFSAAVRPPYSPSNPAQAAQSAAAADRYAQAATRSEIQPGNTLGTNLPSSGSEPARGTSLHGLQRH